MQPCFLDTRLGNACRNQVYLDFIKAVPFAVTETTAPTADCYVGILCLPSLSTSYKASAGEMESLAREGGVFSKSACLAAGRCVAAFLIPVNIVSGA